MAMVDDDDEEEEEEEEEDYLISFDSIKLFSTIR
jgi:hypothetical protein